MASKSQKKTSTRGSKKSPASKSTSRQAKRAAAPAPRERVIWPWLKGRLQGIRNTLAPVPPPDKPKTKAAPAKPAPAAKNDPASPGAAPSMPERSLDIIGVVLALFGLALALLLLSPNNSSITGSLVRFFERALGLGIYLLPVVLTLAGIWLFLRNFDAIPYLAAERIVGFGLLFFLALVGMHYAAFLFFGDGVDAFNLIATGLGGGYIGSLFFELLRTSFGMGGAAVILLAWLVFGLALTLDVPVLELFGWTRPVNVYFQKQIGRAGQWIRVRVFRRSPEPISMFARVEPALPEGVSVGPLAPRDANGLLPGRELPPDEQQVWALPPINQILDAGVDAAPSDDEDRRRSQVIEETLASFGAPGRIVEINRGPTITQFGVEPGFIESRNGQTRVRVGKIASLADDLALALAARRIRIQAPVPGMGYVGIEVPNEEVSLVALRDLMESDAFRKLKGAPLAFALGQDVAGRAVAVNLASMPHILIAGATGAGKSVCVNALITCLLLNNTPNELRLIMVDPKRVELTGYNGIPHLLAPVVVDLERVVGTLQWVMREMDMRYRKLAEASTRNINDYNAHCEARGAPKLPHLVVIIDELADLMMLAPDDTERSITRLAQLARATGIHLVLATQRPSVDVVTGLIKANIPARVAFMVASSTDSRVILDQTGADRLLGRGDMLFQAPDAPAAVRLQGAFVSDQEIQRLVGYWRSFAGASATSEVAVGGIVDAAPSNLPLKQLPMWEEATDTDRDPYEDEAIDIVRRQGRASISMLQRRLRIGYTRAARLIERLEEKGIVSAPEPSTGMREVLDYGEAAPPIDE